MKSVWVNVDQTRERNGSRAYMKAYVKWGKYKKIKVDIEVKKSKSLSVRVFSTIVLIVDTVNKQRNITNRTEIC